MWAPPRPLFSTFFHIYYVWRDYRLAIPYSVSQDREKKILPPASLQTGVWHPLVNEIEAEVLLLGFGKLLKVWHTQRGITPLYPSSFPFSCLELSRCLGGQGLLAAACFANTITRAIPFDKSKQNNKKLTKKSWTLADIVVILNGYLCILFYETR